MLFHYRAVFWLVIFWKKNDTFSLILSRKGSLRFNWSPEKCFHCFSCDMERGFWESGFLWCGPSWQFLETGNFSSESPAISKGMRKSLSQPILYYNIYNTFYFMIWVYAIYYILFSNLKDFWSNRRHTITIIQRYVTGLQTLI